MKIGSWSRRRSSRAGFGVGSSRLRIDKDRLKTDFSAMDYKRKKQLLVGTFDVSRFSGEGSSFLIIFFHFSPSLFYLPFVQANSQLLKRGVSESFQFEGFLVDLMDQIARDMNVDYRFKAQETKGYFNETTSQWNGMIGDILNEVGNIFVSHFILCRDKRGFSPSV